MSDKHVTPKEVVDSLRFVRSHLYAAQAQAIPGDDVIITRHVYDAYKRVEEVLLEIEINGIGMAIPAVYHINKSPLGIEGPFRLLVAACNRLQAEADEYQFDDGIGQGAALEYWYEFDHALKRANEALKDE